MYVLSPNQTVETFPYSIGDLRRDNPNTSFPRNPSEEMLAGWSVFPVIEQEPPSFNPATQNLNQVNPILVDGEWLQAWEVTDFSSEEIAERTEAKAAEVRADRNQRLAACDWTQLPDSPADHEAWAVYRQALRDLTSQAGFPWNINWPEEP
jgi:hypothetical protein